MAVNDNDNKWNLLQAKLNETKVCKAFQIFENSGIEPILIKGFASARFYPLEKGRAYVDVDLCVPAEQFEAAQAHIKTRPEKGVSIDLHRGTRHLDTVSWEKLFENSVVIDLDDAKIRVMSPEDHLRIICTHWLTDGGENKERLWDIFYAVENRPEDFDWKKCLDVVSKNRKFWVIYTIGIAHHFFGLDLSGLPFEKEAKNPPKWLLKEIRKNWDEGIPIVPLAHCLRDKEKFWQQLKKRIPPNPIFATVSMEGSLDAKTRAFYQIGNFAKRIPLSVKDISKGLLRRFKAR